MFRQFVAAALGATLFVSSTAFAATAGANQGALMPGKPASVKQAQSHDDQTPLCWLLGAGVVVGGIALIASGNGHGNIGSTTTCAFGGCPVPPPPTPPPATTTTVVTPPPATTTTTTTH